MAGTQPISSLLVKPAGPDCNLACCYCFYTPKQALYPRPRRHRMSRQVAETMISQYMAISPGPSTFAWQGGEPTLMGLDFFRLVVALQQKHGRSGHVVANALQTNATLLDDDWARFLRRYSFLVGVSIDGPPQVHDHWRLDHGGRPTLEQVLRGAQALRRNNVEYNALVMITSHSAGQARPIWDFLREQGFEFFQFIPCLERDSDTGEASEYSVTAEQWGQFMCEIFDLWAEPDCPETYVRLFDDLLQMYAGMEGPSCELKPRCGEYVVIEHNGDVYPCDFFVEAERRVGNLLETPLAELVAVPELEQFAVTKSQAGEQCRACRWWNICFGGCPKHRLYGSGRTDSATYLCAGYRMLFEHADARLAELARRHLQQHSDAADSATSTAGACEDR